MRLSDEALIKLLDNHGKDSDVGLAVAEVLRHRKRDEERERDGVSQPGTGQ